MLSRLLGRLGSPFRQFSNSSASIGWYGVPGVTSKEYFEKWRIDVQRDCEDLKSKVLATEVQDNAKQVVRLLDTISSRLCLLLDTMEVCSSSHTDKSVRDEALDTYSRLSVFVTKLNMDVNLYKPLAGIVDKNDLFQSLSPEEKRVASSLKLEFERDGIHLSDERKQVVEVLQEKLRAIEVGFMQLERSALGRVKLSLKERGRLLLDTGLAPHLPTNEVQVDFGKLKSVLCHCSDGEIRKKFYVHCHSHNKEESLRMLALLVEGRSALAKTLGFETYADLATSYRMASNPSTVLRFLDDLSSKIARKAKEEMDILRELKSQKEGDGALYAWDVQYYTTQALKSRYGNLLEQSAGYFTLEGCLKGLTLICLRLFGLKLEQVPFAPEEAWADGIAKLQVSEESTGEMAGVLYLDLYSRPGKFATPAHFQVQCSHRELDGKYQLPSCVLVCNFDPRSPYLSHQQILTVFHEFGHALHSLLSRTEFQHLSGTRGELDFVETPSQLMEYFCYDYRVVKEFAFHYKTGEVIPESIVNALNDSRKLFAASELQHQIMFSCCDQKLFGKEGLDLFKTRDGVSNLLVDLAHQYTEIPHVRNTFWISRFSHFVNYGAAYYSYTYARAFASDIWFTCFEKDPWSREAGLDFRNKILQHGGSQDPSAMMKRMLGGRKPNVDAFVSKEI